MTEGKRKSATVGETHEQFVIIGPRLLWLSVWQYSADRRTDVWRHIHHVNRTGRNRFQSVQQDESNSNLFPIQPGEVLKPSSINKLAFRRASWR